MVKSLNWASKDKGLRFHNFHIHTTQRRKKTTSPRRISFIISFKLFSLLHLLDRNMQLRYSMRIEVSTLNILKLMQHSWPALIFEKTAILAFYHHEKYLLKCSPQALCCARRSNLLSFFTMLLYLEIKAKGKRKFKLQVLVVGFHSHFSDPLKSKLKC